MIRLVEADDRFEEELLKAIMDIMRSLLPPVAELAVYIARRHDDVREFLGLNRVEREEWPIKLLENAGFAALSVEYERAKSLDLKRLRLLIARELAVLNALNDPLLVGMFVIDESQIEERLAKAVSLAMLRRVVDYVIARSGLEELLMDADDLIQLRGTLETCGLTAECAITALAFDVPLSIEVAGNKALAGMLWERVSKGVENEFAIRYSDFRDFVRNNFNATYVANSLRLFFK